MHTGRVSTHASNRLRRVAICRPDLLAAMEPATPEESTCVVLTGRRRSGQPRPMVIMATNSAAAPLRVGEVAFADFFSDGHHDALPADHRAQAQSEGHGTFHPHGNDIWWSGRGPLYAFHQRVGFVGAEKNFDSFCSACRWFPWCSKSPCATCPFANFPAVP